jgi:hypothetical protein
MYDLELEALDLEDSAEWRRQKAQQYPEDARRNLEAAQLLEKLAVEIRALDDSEVHRQLSAAIEANDDLFSFSESWSDYKRRIGFWEFPDGQQYLSDMLQTILSQWHPHSEEISN